MFTKRLLMALLGLLVAACSKPAEEVEQPLPLRCMWIVSWNQNLDGSLSDVSLTTDDWGDERKGPGPKLTWEDDGHKVILPPYYTHGEARKIPANKLLEAWQSRVDGVYRIDYTFPLKVRYGQAAKVFKNRSIEVSQ